MKKYFKDRYGEEYTWETRKISCVGYNQLVLRRYNYNRDNEKSKEYIVQDMFCRGILKYRNVTKYIVDRDGSCHIIIHNRIINTKKQETIYKDTYTK